jgi:hypothetical protein
MVANLKNWETYVEYDNLSDTHFISLQDDLLAEVDLNVGDEVEWIDNGDGSWSLKKVEYNPFQLDIHSYASTDEIIEWPLAMLDIDPIVYDETSNGLVSITPENSGWSARFLLNTQ